MTQDRLVFAVPSKGRLMDDTAAVLERAGLTIRKVGHARGYRGAVDELPGVEIAFISASEIAGHLKAGTVHYGVTGEDLVREEIPDAATRIEFVRALGFGHADVVVAVPDFWVDVRTMSELDRICLPFRRAHGRSVRVATKYITLTRTYFEAHGLVDYRIVHSLGATEGTPAARTADLIVDITSTGETLRANGLRILDDGVILKSQANLFVSRVAPWNAATLALDGELRARLKP
jgi:ATP phosphoribosyltransferase